MTDKVIIIVAICAFLAVCILALIFCITYLKWKKHDNERAKEYNKSCENIMKQLVESDADYSVSMGRMSFERSDGKQKVTIKDEDETKHKVLSGIIGAIYEKLRK